MTYSRLLASTRGSLGAKTSLAGGANALSKLVFLLLEGFGVPLLEFADKLGLLAID